MVFGLQILDIPKATTWEVSSDAVIVAQACPLPPRCEMLSSLEEISAPGALAGVRMSMSLNY